MIKMSAGVKRFASKMSRFCEAGDELAMSPAVALERAPPGGLCPAFRDEQSRSLQSSRPRLGVRLDQSSPCLLGPPGGPRCSPRADDFKASTMVGRMLSTSAAGKLILVVRKRCESVVEDEPWTVPLSATILRSKTSQVSLRRAVAQLGGYSSSRHQSYRYR